MSLERPPHAPWRVIEQRNDVRLVMRPNRWGLGDEFAVQYLKGEDWWYALQPTFAESYAYRAFERYAHTSG